MASNPTVTSDDRTMVAWLPTADVRTMMFMALGGAAAPAGPSHRDSMPSHGASRRGRGRGGMRRPQPERRDRRETGRVDRRRHQHQRRIPLPPQDLVPMLNGFQLIGDSMLSRLGTYLTRQRPIINNMGVKQYGACVHGQTASQLARLLRKNSCPAIGDKGVLLIGTNNLLKKVTIEDTKKGIEEAIRTLTGICSQRLIIMTIPPVPKLGDIPDRKLLNEYIKTFSKDHVQILDLEKEYFHQEAVRLELFDRDQIHWSENALKMIRDQIIAMNTP